MTAAGSDRPAETALSDERALAAFRSGQSDDIAAVVRAWSPAMLRLARAQLGDPATAEDVVQEAWMTVLSGLGRFQGRSALRTWVLGIVVNIARRAGARQRRTVLLSGEWWADRAEPRRPAVDPARFDADGGWRIPPVPWPSLPDEQLGLAELRDVVDRAISMLPARQRAVVVAHDGLGLAAPDVAQLFDVSPSNQRVLLHRGRSRLRAAVEDYAAGRMGTAATDRAPVVDTPAAPVQRAARRRPVHRSRADAALACQQLVELVDDYLDSNLDAQLRARVEEHLASCQICPDYVAQVRRLIELTAALTDVAPSPVVDRLVAAVRADHPPRRADGPVGTTGPLPQRPLGS